MAAANSDMRLVIAGAGGRMGRTLIHAIAATKGVMLAGAIEAAVDEVIAKNPDKVAQALAKPTMLGWFVGQVMKTTGGKANPQAVNDLLKAKLGI